MSVKKECDIEGLEPQSNNIYMNELVKNEYYQNNSLTGDENHLEEEPTSSNEENTNLKQMSRVFIVTPNIEYDEMNQEHNLSNTSNLPFISNNITKTITKGFKIKHRERDERYTSEQKHIIVKFMETNLDLAHSKLLSTEGRKKAKLLWEALTVKLNNVLTGSTKSSAKWQRVWVDIKNKTKKKSRRQQCLETHLKPVMTQIDERVLAIIHETMKAKQNNLDKLAYDAKSPKGNEKSFLEENSQQVGLQTGLENQPGSSNGAHTQFIEILFPELQKQNTEVSTSMEDCENISLNKRRRIHIDSTSEPETSFTQEQKNCINISSQNEEQNSTLSSILVLNSKMDTIIDKLDKMTNEHKRTNEILTDMCNILRGIKDK